MFQAQSAHDILESRNTSMGCLHSSFLHFFSILHKLEIFGLSILVAEYDQGNKNTETARTP